MASGSGEVIIHDVENDYEEVKVLDFDKPNHVVFSPNGNEVYVTDTSNRVLIALDAKTFEEIGQSSLGEAPHENYFVSTHSTGPLVLIMMICTAQAVTEENNPRYLTI